MKKNTISFLVAKDVLLLTILLYIYNGGDICTAFIHAVNSFPSKMGLSKRKASHQIKQKPDKITIHLGPE